MRTLAALLAGSMYRVTGSRFALAVALWMTFSHAWQQTALRGFRITTGANVAGTLLFLRKRGWRTRLAASTALVTLDYVESYAERWGHSERAQMAQRYQRLEKTRIGMQWEGVTRGLNATLLLPVELWSHLVDRDWKMLHPKEIDRLWRLLARPGAGMNEEERAEATEGALSRVEDLMTDLAAAVRAKEGDASGRKMSREDYNRLWEDKKAPDAPRPANHGDKPGDDILNALREVADQEGLPPEGSGV